MGNFDSTRWLHSIFKMDITLWFSVLLTVITLGTPASSSEPRVVCYYTNWSVYRPGTARFNPQNINPYLCTHLVYAFGGFTKENSLKPFDKYQDIEKGGYAKFNGLKTYNQNLKTLLAIGGWNEGSSRFSPLVASRERRKEFVRNAIKFLRQNRFDGLDLDWEYPAFRDGGKPKDRDNYAKLVRELREEFENEAEKTGKTRLLLTMAVPAGIEYIQKGFDVKTLNKYLDWMNLLTYDYHSAFEPAVNHHAPLFPYEEPNEYSVDGELNIDYTIKFYLEQGADADKLVLGIPTYGRSYTLFNPDAVALGSPADGPGEQGDATREKGYLAYYEICESLKAKSKKRSPATSDESEEEDDEEKEDEPWTVMHPNPAAMGPVAYKGNQWVGYDDEEIVRKKAEYVAENKLGGIMFWSIDNDDFRGTCHGKPYPLIEAAKESYFAGLGSSINAVTQAPASRPGVTRPSSRRKTRPRLTTTTTTTTTTRKPTIKNAPSSRITSTTPSWSINTPEPPTTPDPGSDFKCVDEGFFPHPRDCKKYFWCLDSGPSNLGIVAHQFTCPSGLYFNKAADSCDFARNVLCKKPAATTKTTTVRPPATTTTSTTTTTTRKAIVSTKNSVLFRTTTTTTTTPTPVEEEYEEELPEEDAEDPRVIKELIDLIKKVGGIEQLEKQLHLGEAAASTDGVVTTTQSSFNKALYQKVLDRTRGKNKFTGSNIIETLKQTVQSGQNSRRGPQNAGLELSATGDRDSKPLRRDRPQYVTINRQRGPTTPIVPDDSEEVSEEAEEAEEEEAQPFRAKSENTQSVATSARPLQYVNIRRGRPNTLSTDTADDTASRNALFERQEALVAISETANVVDSLSGRREVKPEYVTIRRQRPTTEETTTIQYQLADEEDEEGTLLEKEISSRLKYNTIVRNQPNLTPDEEVPATRPPIFKIYTLPTDAPENPDPTTVLAVQISSLLNPPSSSGIEDPDTELPAPVTELVEELPITTTTTTTPVPPTKRTIIPRRRGTTVTTTPAPTSTTQVSPRNYTTVRRQRLPLRRPNEITADSNDGNNSRKIRSTTPDSRELGEGNESGSRRHRGRFQVKHIVRTDDSVTAEASPIASGQIRLEGLNEDEEISFTPVDIEPQLISRQKFNTRTDRRFRRPLTSSTVSDSTPDSEVSAATFEARRPSLIPRGRSRFTVSSTSDATITSTTGPPLTPRRPTFARFSPRPFSKPSTPDDVSEEVTVEAATQKSTRRLPLGRTRSTPATVPRKSPFLSRQTTTQQTLTTTFNDDDDELETRPDDISLSESAREEKEHDETETTLEEELSTRRVIIKKLRTTGSTDDTIMATEIVPIDTGNGENGRKRFRVIRRRPTSSTTLEPLVFSDSPTTPGLQRIRKVIRKKLRPAEHESDVTTKTINTFQSSTSDNYNYGDKTNVPLATTTTENEPVIEQITEFYKEEGKSTEKQRVESEVELPTDNQVTEPVLSGSIELLGKKETDQIILQTTTTPSNVIEPAQSETTTVESTKEHSETVIEKTSNNELSQSSFNGIKSEDEVLNTSHDDITNDSNNYQIKSKAEITIINEEKNSDISSSKDIFTTESPIPVTDVPETTTTSTTILTTLSSRTRLPYRPRKRIFTSSTEPSVSSTSKTYSRKYNPGVYTSPASRSSGITRRPFSSKQFTRRPFTAKTTQKVEEEEEDYSEENSEVDEQDQENPFVFVPANQLFTRKPDDPEGDDESEELLEEGEGDENIDEEDGTGSSKFSPATSKPGFKPRVVNSNTFRTSTSTTELPKRLKTSQNRTSVIHRFGGNKSETDKKRVQNVPQGYNSPLGAVNNKNSAAAVVENSGAIVKNIGFIETTTGNDEYLTETATSLTNVKAVTIPDVSPTVNSVETETQTDQIDIDDSTNDYLEFIDGTTNYPTTQDITTFTQTEPELQTTIAQNALRNKEATIGGFLTDTSATTTTTTTLAPAVSPIIKTQFDKLFSVSRVVEVHSKLDKHRVNKNNETTLIEEGKIVVEKKPVVDKIGEVSRYSLIKIVEDEIPIYLTKFGHVYPVDNPPENIIRIDEARNARALKETIPDVTREPLLASESINEGYRHIKEVHGSKNIEYKSHIEHVPNDQFLSYVNEDKNNDKDAGKPYFAQWQFVPAAYENEKIKAAQSYDVITPRSLLTNPSTLSLEGLFKTEIPFMARQVSDNDKNVSDDRNQHYAVYSADAVNQQKDTNINKVSVLKPETGGNIITFAKGQEFNGGSVVEQSTIQGPVYVPLFNEHNIGSTQTPLLTTAASIPLFTSTPENATSSILDLLSTTGSIIDVTSISTTVSPTTTEAVTEDTTTIKLSPVDAKRAKFGFPRRPIIKSSNFTRPSIVPRTVKKINTTIVLNSNQKVNKTTFSPSKSRFSGNRVQNIPVDFKKKSTPVKLPPKPFGTTKVYTTESPKSTTEKKSYLKPIRPAFRPSFLSRKATPTATSGDT